MRKLAERLSVGPLAIAYTHVPGKAELVDLMFRQLYADMPRRARPTRLAGARPEAVARDNQVFTSGTPG